MSEDLVSAFGGLVLGLVLGFYAGVLYGWRWRSDRKQDVGSVRTVHPQQRTQ